MSALPQDEDLNALLNDLDDLDGAVEIVSKPIKQPKKKVEKKPEEKINVPEHKLDPEPPKIDDNPDIKDIYTNSIHELLSNYRKDRQDVDQLVAYLWEKLEKSEPSRVLFETLAVSLRTKSEANSNLLKLIDTLGKKLDKTSGVEGLDLEGLLDD